MRTFNLLTVSLFCSLFFIGCSKENAENEISLSKADYPFTSCVDYKLSLGDGDKFDDMLSRGWEGEVDDNAQILPTVYPLDKIYMLCSHDGGLWSKYSVLELPVYELDGKRVFDICFRAEGSKIWAKNGADSILVTDGTSYPTMFSSIPKLETTKDLCDVKTPVGVQTYEPYGDRLFKSQNFKFSASGDVIINIIDDKPVTEMTVNLDRLTNVIIPRFILCDDLDEEKSEYTMNLNKFTDFLGSPEDWEVRVFVAGNSSAGSPYSEGFPVEYKLLKGTNESGKRGVISVSKDIQRLDPNFTHNTISVGGKTTTYEGVGFHSESSPFIFPAKTSGKADLCYTFSYVGDDEKVKARIKRTTNTFRLHATEDLTGGSLRLVTVVIDIDDFVKAFIDNPSNEGSRVSHSYDPVFGEVSKVPYRIISE